MSSEISRDLDRQTECERVRERVTMCGNQGSLARFQDPRGDLQH